MKNKKIISVLLSVFSAGLLLLASCSSDSSQETIILSGTITINYEDKPVPFVEIGVEVPGHDWISTKIPSPGPNAPWSIELPAFNSPTKISFKVTGYNEKNICLFVEIREPDPQVSAYSKDIKGIKLDLGNISNTPVNIIPLIEDKWSNGEITVGGTVEWYSFNVVAGIQYYIWWNDSLAGDDVKTLDIDVHAYDSVEKEITLENNDSAWDDPISFTSVYTGKVYFRVRALYLALSTGTYAIVYSKTGDRPNNDVNNITGIEQNPIPLTLGVWANDSLPSSTSGRTVWYSFNVTEGTTYYVWWNDKEENSGKTLDIKVDAYFSGAPIFVEADSAWTTPMYFTAKLTGTQKLKVSSFYRIDAGTFAIVYNTSGTRP